MTGTKPVAIALLIAGNLAWAQTPPKSLAPDAIKPGPVTASIDLGAEFPQMKGYTLAQTLTTVAPRSGMPWHSHAGTPEIVRVISGTLSESRNGGPPVAYGPGSTLINAGGVQHMWANLGTEPVVLLGTAVHALPK